MPNKKLEDSKGLRLRIFAGPNGSGKTTIIESIRSFKEKNRKINFGYYINADEIAKALQNKNLFDFSEYGFEITNKEFKEIVLSSGLVPLAGFSVEAFSQSYTLRKNIFRIKEKALAERLAQIAADVIRKKLLNEQKRFSFETVFSHKSKLDIMKLAVDAGYKVYLYFVSTESPEINKFRVQARKSQGGHNVPKDKIEKRYKCSLQLMYEASKLAYQAFFFDNSKDGKDFKMFAHFKIVNGKKIWDGADKSEYPEWFKIYYLNKEEK